MGETGPSVKCDTSGEGRLAGIAGRRTLGVDGPGSTWTGFEGLDGGLNADEVETAVTPFLPNPGVEKEDLEVDAFQILSAFHNTQSKVSLTGRDSRRSCRGRFKL